MVARALAVLLLVVAESDTAVAVRLGGGVRWRDGRDELAVPVRLRGGPTLQPLPSRRRPPSRRPLPPPSNTSTINAIDALGRHWLVYERAFSLLVRMVQATGQRIKTCVSVLINYPPRVMVVTMSGVIAHESEVGLSAQAILDPALVSDESLASARRSGELINLERFDEVLGRAFGAARCRAVALVINSPGGSPAQSSLIYQRLRALRKSHKKIKLLAYVQDSAASGGYYISCAADEIICDTNSIIGSIGVVSRGFGYVRALKKKGVERRLHTAGESKAGMDPYLPVKSAELARQRRLLHELHANFIDAVKEGRGARLNPEAAARLHHRTSVAAGGVSSRLPSALTAPSRATLRKLQAGGAGLFDGSVYAGSAGVEVGLADAVGEMGADLIARYGRHVQLTPVAPEEPINYGRLLRWLL